MTQTENAFAVLQSLQKRNAWEHRIFAELDFLRCMFEADHQPLPELMEQVLRELCETVEHTGGLNEAAVLAAEAALAVYQPQVKAYTVSYVAHAHIDMNWMWGMPETTGVIIDTFQTMLNLLDEYPDYIFSQSQAAAYQIIEKYAPSMLPAIKRRVKEGRWEITAATWVEADKNLSGSEAMARQLIYSKKYLRELFSLEDGAIEVDFEPDTFGHSPFVPEFLHQAGIPYYFHCRGNDQEEIYRWRAPSGSEVLVYREPNWYHGPVTYGMNNYVPAFCKRNHTRHAMVVYGVGDHGGGPTRRDLERIMEMRAWPLLPQIRFSRLGDYFHLLEESRSELPVVERELNYVFTGCYTTHSRIKLANRIAENNLYDSEALCVMERLCGGHESNPGGHNKAWEDVLFNQFHDILPGSCTDESAFCALGKYQEAMSYSLACANRAMKAIGDCIDTTALGQTDGRWSTSEGAGVGYNTMATPSYGGWAACNSFRMSETCRGKGNLRAYTLFNTTQYDRTELVELSVWDWELPMENTQILTPDAAALAYEVVEEGNPFWRHTLHKLVFLAQVPAFGYANYYLRGQALPVHPVTAQEPRVHRMADGSYTLENGTLRAVFSTGSLKLVSLFDKQNRRELLDQPAAGFRLVEEEDTGDYSAWTMGEYRKVEDLNDTCPVRVLSMKTEGLRQHISYAIAFRQSKIEVTVTLDEGADTLRFAVHTAWREVGARGETTPQLQFCVPFGYASSKTRYDVPGGSTDRPQIGHDVPAIHYGAPIPTDGGSCMFVTSNGKYGFRTHENTLIVNLLRATYSPDPYPDQGIHNWQLGLGVCPSAQPQELLRRALCFSRPVYLYSNSIHAGHLGQSGSFLSVKSEASVLSVKKAEADDAIVLRVCGGAAAADMESSVPAGYHAAWLTDLHEKRLEKLEIREQSVTWRLNAGQISTICFSK